MGNSSSQQFSETGPQYRYHENVLRDAQRRLQPLQQAEDTACFSDDDEQFYSAEEGDSSSSVTPERRRPESSSGEEQISDEESGEEELTDVGSSLVSSPLQLPSSRRSTRSYGQCNVSVFQEHDSIGPELEAASRGHENLMSRQNNSSILKRTCPTADIDQEIPKRIKLKTRRSPFQPICSGSRQQRLINCLNSSLSPGKRKIQSCIDEVAAPPNKKMLNDSPSKRKRLGYFDSSESEPDKEEEQRGRSRRKKGKLSQSVKKRKKMSPESSCDEVANKKGKESKYETSEEESSRSNEDEQKGDESKPSSREERDAKRKTNSYIGRANTETPLNPMKRNLRDRVTLPITSNSNMNNFNGERSTRSLVTKNEGQRQQNDAIARHNTRLGGYEQNLPKNNEGKLADRSLDDESFIHPSTEPEQGTRKMGNQGIKNVQGKLLPLRQLCSSSALLPSRPVNCQRKQPQIMNNDLSDSVSETSTISKRLRRASSAFMTLQSSPAMAKLQKTNKSWQDSGDCQVVNKVRQTSDNSIVYSSKNTANPFQNVKLVPPSNSSNASLKTRSQLEKDAQNTSDIPSNMETDESYSSVENGSALSTMKIAEFSKRPIAIAKKSRGKTVAERFHNFWSQNQTKSNIQTLLSKMKAPLSIIPTKDFKNTRSNTGLATQSSGSASVTHLNKDGHSKAMSTTSSAFYPISNPDHQMLLAPASLKESQLSDQGFSPCSNPGTAQTYLHDRSTANAVGPRLRRRQASARLASPSADLHKTTLPQPQTAATASPLSVVHILPQASQFQVLHAQLAGCLSLSVSLGDLSEASATGLVNWTDGNLTHTVTACSQAVAAKAGALLIAGCADYLTNKGSPLEPPDVLTTVAGGRFHPNVESILHVVAPPVGSTEISSPSARNYSQEGQGQTESEHSRALLLQVYANCLRFAEERLGLTSLAFPLIGQGIFSIETCVHCFCDSLLVFLHEQGFPRKTPSSSLTSVELIIADARTTDLVAERLHSCLDRLSSLQNFESAITEIFKTTLMYAATSVRHQGVLNEPVLSTSSDRAEDQESQQRTRAISGRPKVKRPRL